MTRYVALLRAINVSGHNMIKMTELKRLFEAMGFGRVQTYINSGNVLFDSAEEEAPLRQRLEAQIQATFGLSITVLMRTVAAIERVIADCPFPAEGLAEGEALYVSFLAEAPSAAGIERLHAWDRGVDELRIVGREVYLLYRQSVAKTKLSNALLEQKLKVESTARNWRTTNKLVELGRA